MIPFLEVHFRSPNEDTIFLIVNACDWSSDLGRDTPDRQIELTAAQQYGDLFIACPARRLALTLADRLREAKVSGSRNSAHSQLLRHLSVLF